MDYIKYFNLQQINEAEQTFTDEIEKLKEEISEEQAELFCNFSGILYRILEMNSNLVEGPFAKIYIDLKTKDIVQEPQPGSEAFRYDPKTMKQTISMFGSYIIRDSTVTPIKGSILCHMFCIRVVKGLLTVPLLKVRTVKEDQIVELSFDI
jgi:hypothetical protein